jgi:hypothetical protein
VCCDVRSGQCKVQTAFSVGPTYVDVTGNRTRSDTSGAPTTIITDFTAGMEMEVDLATMTCQEWCPVQGTLSPYQIDPTAVNIGSRMINGKMCTGWQWNETVLKIIVMQVTTIWVDQETNLPVQEYDQLTPFGQSIGFQSTTYLQFNPTRPPAKLFQVNGQQNCKNGGQDCQQQVSLQRRVARARFAKKQFYSEFARTRSEREMLQFA